VYLDLLTLLATFLSPFREERGGPPIRSPNLLSSPLSFLRTRLPRVPQLNLLISAFCDPLPLFSLGESSSSLRRSVRVTAKPR